MAQWNLSASCSETDRIIEYDPLSYEGSYAAPIYFVRELIAIDDEIVEIIGASDAPTVGWIVNRGVWFTEPVAHNSGTVARIIDIHRTSISAAPGALVELFELDASAVGDTGGPYRFVNGFQTVKSRAELLMVHNKTDLTAWTALDGATVSPNAVGSDGNTIAYMVVGPVPVNTPTIEQSFAVPDDALSYHVKLSFYTRGSTEFHIGFTGGTSVTYGFMITPTGAVTNPGVTAPANFSAEPTEEGFFQIEFDIANNALGNEILSMTLFPGVIVESGEAGFTIFETPQVFGPGGQVYWGGDAYIPLPVLTSGFEMSSRGALPTPRIKMGNSIVGGLIAGLLEAYSDLIGAKISRYRTFAKHLDTGTEPDRRKHYRPDVYTINRKVAQNKLFVELELSVAIDQQGLVLPARPLLRDYCAWQYRRWSAQIGDFSYTNVECPYTGGTFFDHNDNLVTDPALDRCSKRLTGCRARFGAGNPLPTAAFPGVALWR